MICLVNWNTYTTFTLYSIYWIGTTWIRFSRKSNSETDINKDKIWERHGTKQKKKLDSSRIVCYTLDANEKSKAELKRVTNYDLKCMHDKNENKRTVVQQQQQQSRKEQNKWQNIKSRPTTTKHWITYSITLYCLTSDPIPIQTCQQHIVLSVSVSV